MEVFLQNIPCKMDDFGFGKTESENSEAGVSEFRGKATVFGELIGDGQ